MTEFTAAVSASETRLSGQQRKAIVAGRSSWRRMPR